MTDIRLIERWLPIAELGIESIRERTPMTPFPAPNRLHVWWARRPLVAARAAVLASLLPENIDRKKFMHAMGIHGNPIETRRQIDAAKRNNEDLGSNPYGYKRAFTYKPSDEDKHWIVSVAQHSSRVPIVLDPTAGGGSIPFESSRLGFASIANDLNPVATLILKATVDWPMKYGSAVHGKFQELSEEFIRRAEEKYKYVFPTEPNDIRIEGYLWARTVNCPYCDGLVPLSPNWKLANGIGICLKPDLGSGPGSIGRICSFEIVKSTKQQSPGTVSRGDGVCPYTDCGRVIDSDEIKKQAQTGHMNEQLYAIVYKKRTEKILKSGKKGKPKWIRCYRSPQPKDDNSAEIRKKLDEKLLEWEVFDIIPNERFPEVSNDNRPIQYGMPLWRDMFSPRQLLCHGMSVEVFREMLDADSKAGILDDVRKAAYGYLAFSLDKLRDYNSRMSVWHSKRQVVTNTFSQHDYSFKWSYVEIAPLIVGRGYDWVIVETAKCINELIKLVRLEANDEAVDLFDSAKTDVLPPITITCKSGDALDNIKDDSIDAVVMDPPYYDNVMYAELSDFFYVWLKRTAGHVYPALFRSQFTDKDSEAVANPTRFRGERGAKTLAGWDYQKRMASVFAECHRVLKPDGVMTLMFTHKATGAWDALTTGLMEAGFTITASWPINTEAKGSLHIRNKAAANSTIFLVCRPRTSTLQVERDLYWEDVEQKVAQAVRTRVEEFQDAGIAGVDLYLASFGPALEEFSRHWPLRRGTPRDAPEERRRRRQQVLFEENWDPYAATPEDALNAARREVKRWRLERLTRLKADADLDASTAFFVLAWDAFKAPIFSYDEALQLARAVGIDLDSDIVDRLAAKKGSDIVLWDSTHRAAKGTLGPVDGSRGMIDTIHHGANMARKRTLAAAQEMLTTALMDQDPRFFAALEAVLEVLPVSKTFTGIELENEAAASGSDFEILYNLSRLAYKDEIPEPQQLKLLLDN